MKKLKSLTLLTAVIALTACANNKSATFSSLYSSTPSAIESSLYSSSDESISSPSSINEPSSINIPSSIKESSNEPSSINESSSNPVVSSNPVPSSLPVSSLEPVSSSQIAPSSQPISSNPISSSQIVSSSESAPSSAPISSSVPQSSEPFIPNYGELYGGYYQNLVSWTNGEDLKNQLNAIIREGYQPLSYKKSNSQNYDTNIDADHSKDDFEYLDVLYSKEDTFKTETNKGWQREHAWCASLMCGSGTGTAIEYRGRATDFHNLFAASAGGNQSRGNKNYGYANKKMYNFVDRTVDNGQDGYSYDGVTFEPADKDKGRLARAIFYMATMYKDEEYESYNKITMKGLTIVEDSVDYVQGNDCYFAIGHLSDLLAWNNNTPVDYLEMQHNISVYSNTNNVDGYAQGNRNPYVDFPGLVDYVYGDKMDQPGSLDDVIASASYLNSESNELSHYAIKEAKREYGLGEKISAQDYKIVAVNYNYSFSEASANLSHSLSNHIFVEEDGDIIEAKISTPVNDLDYQIVLNPMGLCNSGTLVINTTGINKTTPNIDQSVSYGEIPFYFNFETTYSDVANSGMTINNISTGGITVGSNPRSLTKLTIKTKESYTIDQAYIKANAGNTTSSYKLVIKVGDDILLSETAVPYNDKKFKLFGAKTTMPLTGQVSFIFTGSTSLMINSVAFNSIIV